ncbi:MAG TPA: hypothetical protein DCZ91_20390, partial [Lachnospiraceae bacterium]|nr:hypothetical protein [Lachnospiraceae bacterium]
MRFRKGLALLLAAALTMSIAPQTCSLASASEGPSVQESMPESGAADSGSEAGMDSAAPESG